MTENIYIVWDLGATKCAAALVLVRGDHYSILKSHTVKLQNFLSLDEMSSLLHEKIGASPREVDGICIAGAGQYNGQALILDSGYPFPMTLALLAKQRRWAALAVIHDYTPIVCSTYVDQPDQNNVITLNPGVNDRLGQRVAFGVGSGLGVKQAVRLASGELAFGTNEMGHIGLCWPPRMNQLEATLHREFVDYLQAECALQRHDVTFEAVLSGRGLARIYQFIKGAKFCLSPEETAAAIKVSGDQEALKLFAWYLGVFIGTLQLTFMPSGGVWIYGGVIHKNLVLFEAPYIRSLQRGMQACPAYWDKRQDFPLRVLVGQKHAFFGAAYYAEKCFDLAML